MPRDIRLDEEGAYHHVTFRGIEKRNIFLDASDYLDFLERLDRVFTSTGTLLISWALLPNHAHLFLRSSATPISSVMRRLLTGHAVSFNRNHKRVGHLLQNRFKSILVDKDEYFLALLAYVNLNPILHGFIKEIHQLETYPWTSHRAMLGLESPTIVDMQQANMLFPQNPDARRKAYIALLEDTLKHKDKLDLEGGGLIRSAGGWEAVDELQRGRERWTSDERVLGSSAFVENVICRLERRETESEEDCSLLVSEELLPRWLTAEGIEASEFFNSSRKPLVADFRYRVAYFLVRHLNKTPVQAANLLKCSLPTIGRAVERFTKGIEPASAQWFKLAKIEYLQIESRNAA